MTRDLRTAHQRHTYNVSQLQPLAKRIKKMLAEGSHFALVVFDQAFIGERVQRMPFGEPMISAGGYSTYVSNAERQSMITALRECADILERKLDMPGAHPDRSKGH